MRRRPDLVEARRKMVMIRSNGIGDITIWLLPVQCRTNPVRKRSEGDTSTCKGPTKRRRCLSDRAKDSVDAQIKVEVAIDRLTWEKR